MAIIPQLAPASEDRASGAQVIDGSLKFDGAANQYLTRSPSTAGNQRTWTYSVWFKRTDFSNEVILFGADEDNTNVHNWGVLRIGSTNLMNFLNNISNSTGIEVATSQVFRDDGWYHVVLAVDTTQATAANRVKLYVNGEQVTSFTTANYPTQNYDTQINSTLVHWIGREARGYYYRGYMSQAYMIDGQQLEPAEFGYTDPLTNTWRPKKFSGTYSGEYPLADYTGGLPILATNSLGTAVTSGTRADSNSANIVLAVPFNGNVTDYSATIKGSGSALVGSTDSITYPTTNDKYYGSSVYQNADGDVAWYITGESAFTIGTGAFTVECWVRNDGNHDGAGGANEDQYVWHFTDINMRLRMWKPSGGSRIITFYTGDITNEPTVATVADNEWHHIAVVREGTGSNQFKIYVNGVLSYTGTDGTNLSGDKFMVGNYSTTADYGFSGNIQDIRVYNAAKYTSAFTVPPDRNLAAGTNSFYLPLDGNTLIGKDQSGKGNDWTPVNFGGSTVIPKATGALPILNTVSGGKVATVGVRTDPYYANLVLALPLDGNAVDVSNQINSGSSTKTMTANGNAAASTAQSDFYGGSYYFDGNGDYLSTPDSTDWHLGTSEFTIECFIRKTANGTNNYDAAIATGVNGSYHDGWSFLTSTGDDAFRTYDGSGGGGMGLEFINNTFTTDGKWHHIAVSRDSSNVARLFLDGIIQDEETWNFSIPDSSTPLYVGAQILDPGNVTFSFNGYIQDVRIYKGVAKYTKNFIPASTNPDILPDTPSGIAYKSELTKPTSGAVAFDGADDYLRIASSSDFDQNAGTDFTAECFFYMTEASGPSHIFGFQIDANNRTSLYFTSNSTTLNWWTSLSGSNGNRVSVSNVSLNAWHHVAITRSGSTTTMWFDGISQGTSTTTDYPNGSQLLDIGTYNGSGYNPDDFPGFISNVRYVKGTAVYTANFTPPTSPLTNITNTKVLCCQGSNAVNYAVSPGAITANGNTKAATFNPFDDDIDIVRGKPTGYCTLNPLRYGGTVEAPKNGNLEVGSAASGYGGILCTQGMSSGKWYFEFVSTSGYGAIGIAKQDVDVTTYLGLSSLAYIYLTNGNKANNNSYVSYGPTWTTGDVMGVSFDADNGILTYYKNGISLGSAYTGLTSGPYYPAFSDDFGSSRGDGLFNFGQKPFSFNPPDGFQPLNAANLPNPGVTRPDKYFTPTLYTGSGSGAQYVSAGFKPDMVWIKSRSNAWYWNCYDSVRGSGKDGTDDAAYYIGCNDTSAQTNVNAVSGTQFQGFYGGDTYGGYIPHYYTGGSGQELNTSGATYVGYCWKAGGGTGAGGEFWKDDKQYATAAAAGLDNTSGGSTGTDSKFAILRYTGTGSEITMGHSLGTTPACAIHKCISHSGDWTVWHDGLDSLSKILILNNTGSQGNMSSGITSWNSTQLVMDTDGGVNSSGRDYLLYLWANVPGVQKFGKFEGNSANDGTYVDLGFRPALLILKNMDNGSAPWYMLDNKRSPYNEVVKSIQAQSNGAEATDSNFVDFLSNGFKMRTSGAYVNQQTMIYMAWAHQPYHNLYGAQSNAR